MRIERPVFDAVPDPAEITDKAARSTQLFDCTQTIIDDGQRQTRRHIENAVAHGIAAPSGARLRHTAPRELVHNESFNVGQTAENYRVREIAEMVAEVVPNSKVTFGPSSLR